MCVKDLLDWGNLFAEAFEAETSDCVTDMNDSLPETTVFSIPESSDFIDFTHWSNTLIPLMWENDESLHDKIRTAKIPVPRSHERKFWNDLKWMQKQSGNKMFLSEWKWPSLCNSLFTSENGRQNKIVCLFTMNPQMFLFACLF